MSLSGALNGVPHFSLITFNSFFSGNSSQLFFPINTCNFETCDLNKKIIINTTPLNVWVIYYFYLINIA